VDERAAHRRDLVGVGCTVRRRDPADPAHAEQSRSGGRRWAANVRLCRYVGRTTGRPPGSDASGEAGSGSDANTKQRSETSLAEGGSDSSRPTGREPLAGECGNALRCGSKRETIPLKGRTPGAA
jgi:hypothetical protein